MKRSNQQIQWLPWEEELLKQDFLSIAGVDEAGCGPLAGPVVAAAVILPICKLKDPSFLLGLNDSKKLSDKQKNRLFDEITQECHFAIGTASVEEIDQINIRQADYLAMERAVRSLKMAPDALLIDAWRLPFWHAYQQGIPQGDAKVRSIAAASVIAKVTRDRIMLEIDLQYPQYGFARHKGYGTKLHYEAIATHGLCPQHRRSFLKNLDAHRGDS